MAVKNDAAAIASSRLSILGIWYPFSMVSEFNALNIHTQTQTLSVGFGHKENRSPIWRFTWFNDSLFNEPCQLLLSISKF
jgi:hypothetical protein